MATFLNIRGTNGSGKSTLARKFFGPDDATVDLVSYADGKKERAIRGQINPEFNSVVIGDYSTMAGGLDKIKTFALQFAAIEAALLFPETDLVVAEGVLASTVLGSWAEHAKKLHDLGHRVIWAFLSVPPEVCVARIYARNGGKPFKEDLVHGKWSQIDKVRQKAECRPWIQVEVLPVEREWERLQEVLGWQNR